MSKLNTSKKVNVLTRFLWFVAGAETETLELCPHDHRKFEAIGMTILMTSLAGFAAGASAAWYFTENSLWSIAFGVFWAMLIFSIDRSLVVTFKKDPYKHSYYVLPLLFRGVLAFLVAGIMSIPLELLVFNGFIQNDIENYKSDLLKQQNEDSFDAQQAAIFEGKSKDLEKSLEKEEDKLKRIDEKLGEKRAERQSLQNQLNRPDTPSYRDAQASVNSLQSRLNQLYNLPSDDYRRNNIPGIRSQIGSKRSAMAVEREKWNAMIHSEIDKVDSEITQLEKNKRVAEESKNNMVYEKNRVDSIKNSYREKGEISTQKTVSLINNGNNFTLYYGVLSHAIYKTHKVKVEKVGNDGKKYTYEEEEYVNKDFMFLLWFIRAMFFVIEMLPSIVKIASESGQYELRIFHQENELKEYLESQEYKDYCHDMLNSENQLRLELQQERIDAEKQVQQNIIKDIIAAEESVAQESIDEWEKKEKGKLRAQNANG